MKPLQIIYRCRSITDADDYRQSQVTTSFCMNPVALQDGYLVQIAFIIVYCLVMKAGSTFKQVMLIFVRDAINYNSCSSLGFLEGTLNSAMCAQTIFQRILVLFLQQESDILFQWTNTRLYDSTLLNNLRKMFHNFHGLHDCQRMSPIKHLRNRMRQHLTRLVSQPTTFAILDQKMQKACSNVSQPCVNTQGEYIAY